MTTTVRKLISVSVLLILTLVGAGCGTPTSTSNSGSGAAYVEGGDAVPKEIEQMALDYFAANYDGKNLEVYGRASITVGELRKLEPGNTSGWAESEQRDEDVIYAVFVTGDMSIQGPPGDNGESNSAPFSAGRMLLDEKGFRLGTRFWGNGNKESASPPFGEQFDDR